VGIVSTTSLGYWIYKGPTYEEMCGLMKSLGSGFIDAKVSFYCSDMGGTGKYMEIIVPASSIIVSSKGSWTHYSFNCMAELKILWLEGDSVIKGDSSKTQVDGCYSIVMNYVAGSIYINIAG